MRTIDAAKLEALGTRIFTALGAPEADARLVATLLVRANLRGHDSHGAIRIPQYAGAIRTGHVNPKSPTTVLADTPVTASLNVTV